MLFTDSTFLFVLLPLLLASYFLAVWVIPGHPQTGVKNAGKANWLLLTASVAFYAAGAGWFTAIVLSLVALTHLGARGIQRARESGAGTAPEALLTFGVTGHIMLFGIFKYASPVAVETLQAGSVEFAVPQLLVPLGFSLIVCHSIAYLVDVYRDEAAPYASPIDTGLYLLFLPVLIAGPILRHRDVRKQFTERKVGMAAFSYGVRRFAVGWGKAFLIAGTLAEPSDSVFSTPVGQLGTASAWLGVVCFSLQVYFSFSGYADMAVGLGRMLGFRLPENFKWPYASVSLHDFWRRWNISLFGWMRAYPALPLDSGRGDGGPRASLALVSLFVLIGLWHGPGWSVVWWGVFHGAVVIIERLGLAAAVRRAPAALGHAYLLAVVMVGWVIFRAESVSDAIQFVQTLVVFDAGAEGLSPLPLTLSVGIAMAAGALGAVPLVSWLSRWVVTVDAMAASVLMLVSTAVVFAWRNGIRLASALGWPSKRS